MSYEFIHVAGAVNEPVPHRNPIYERVTSIFDLFGRIRVAEIEIRVLHYSLRVSMCVTAPPCFSVCFVFQPQTVRAFVRERSSQSTPFVSLKLDRR